MTTDLKDRTKLNMLYGVDASFTQIITPSTVAQIGWSYAQAMGYQENPYAYVYASASPDGPKRANQPRFKSRHVGTFAVKQGLPYDMALQTDYRYYQDN